MCVYCFSMWLFILSIKVLWSLGPEAPRTQPTTKKLVAIKIHKFRRHNAGKIALKVSPKLIVPNGANEIIAAQRFFVFIFHNLNTVFAFADQQKKNVSSTLLSCFGWAEIDFLRTDHGLNTKAPQRQKSIKSWPITPNAENQKKKKKNVG